MIACRGMGAMRKDKLPRSKVTVPMTAKKFRKGGETERSRLRLEGEGGTYRGKSYKVKAGGGRAKYDVPISDQLTISPWLEGYLARGEYDRPGGRGRINEGGVSGGGLELNYNFKEGGMAGGKWIQDAIKRPGALRAKLGVKGDKPIPAKKLAKAAKAPGKLGKQARLAQTLKGLRKG